MANYILYKKADFDDITVLAELRVAMLCETKENGVISDRLKTEIFDSTKQYIENGFKDGSFIAWSAIDSHSKILATSGLTLYAIPPNGWCPNGKTAYIGNLYTLPEFRKKGIGTHLFGLNMEEAKKNDCQRILLDATDAGKPIYEKYGFEKSDTTMAYYPFRNKQQNFMERLGIHE
ncbi:MAG: GNAT family N-acetyltransferase [Oscillospiraceae bacterium]|nr:GNAT family N-acetyltransferase [Oscillospiraceae bacterium]